MLHMPLSPLVTVAFANQNTWHNHHYKNADIFFPEQEV